MTSDNPGTPPQDPSADAAKGQSPQIRLELDASKITPSYANMCAVTPMPLEVIMDFVMMTAPPERVRSPIKVNNRVIVNYYSAKQLMVALRRAVERYEAMYGPLELDPRKRLTPSAREMLMQQSADAPDNVGDGGDGSQGAGEKDENTPH